VEGLGDGVASVAVGGGRVFTLGYRADNEYVTALSESTGKKLWDARIGPDVKENRLMRWLSQRTPTLDEDRLYAVTVRGELVCLRSADGKELWRKSYAQDFAGKGGVWGYCDYPLVDGERLICVPGGARATMVALNKKTGELIWKCAVPTGDSAGYAATVVSEVGGIRQYVNFLQRGVVGVAAKDGKLLWRYDQVANRLANAYSPLVGGDFVFCASGYGGGIAFLKLARDGEGLAVKERYFAKRNLPPWHSSLIRLEGHVYLGTNEGLECVALETGETVWQGRRSLGRFNSVWADGRFYLRFSNGQVLLVDATPQGYAEKGRLRIPGAGEKPGSVAPVVAGGRLYLRDDDLLFCYDVLQGVPAAAAGGPAPAPPKPAGDAMEATSRPGVRREADAIFVPTPQDVVEKMLELAKVKRTDVVYDLGSGDGRIVVAAARKYGCKAVGYEIDPELVKLARQQVAQEGVGRLVTIERKDLFTVDLGGADVIALYLLPRLNARLLPQLEKLKAGSRIVSHAFPIPGVRPDQELTVRSMEDGVKHTIYLWTTPLKKDKEH
jgi:outer membrane protein assembly factor BamB